MSKYTELYGGDIIVRFGEANHRYTISKDDEKTWNYVSGVTTIINSTIAKRGLELWPLDEGLKYLFGQTFEEVTQDDGSIIVEPIYNAKTAQLKPGYGYITLELENLLKQARKAHTIKRDAGGGVGSEVHAAIADFLVHLQNDGTAQSIEMSKEATKAFWAWTTWARNNIGTIVGVERVVYSKKFDYCGTLDAVLEIDGKKVLVDWKTSNYSRTAPLGVYAENFIQLGGYAQAYEEEHGEVIDDLLIVNASKQGKVNTVYASEIGVSVKMAKELFINTWRLWDAKTTLSNRLKEIK